jgi:TolB-like protein
MSGDPNREYFSDGITDDIITELSAAARCSDRANSSSNSVDRESISGEVQAVIGVHTRRRQRALGR